ncbi:hypothetical protein XarzCFBP7410_01035 [Xanthomonas arboricola pv. zantedeschiae]|nr:hypothetical protein XarzCFBP7410_01035 [Xanthomonas arboricola pv. zantedeschiae]PPU14074.1 hypothetical protein XarjCFBP1022_03195 [Xanthomonas arboricola]
MRTDHPDRSLPTHRRGTLSGMDAAPEPTRTYLRRVLRWWAGEGPAAKRQINNQSQVSQGRGGRPNPQSRIPNPQSQPLRHPARAPSAPAPANPDAAAA